MYLFCSRCVREIKTPNEGACTKCFYVFCRSCAATVTSVKGACKYCRSEDCSVMKVTMLDPEKKRVLFADETKAVTDALESIQVQMTSHVVGAKLFSRRALRLSEAASVKVNKVQELRKEAEMLRTALRTEAKFAARCAPVTRTAEPPAAPSKLTRENLKRVEREYQHVAKRLRYDASE
eukprot:Hpha_TRINITY_DN8560_c0_g1::TRINITY_DN8560_c0_g1_i1::g.146282::m.146282